MLDSPWKRYIGLTYPDTPLGGLWVAVEVVGHNGAWTQVLVPEAAAHVFGVASVRSSVVVHDPVAGATVSSSLASRAFAETNATNMQLMQQVVDDSGESDGGEDDPPPRRGVRRR